MKQLYVVFVTALLSYCDCSDIPLTCPGEEASPYAISCMASRNCSHLFERKNFTWLHLNKDTGQVTLQFNTFDTFCCGHYEFILEALETNTEDRCQGIVFGPSYAAKNEFTNHGSDHSVWKGAIERYGRNQSHPLCEKSVNITYNMVYRGCYRLKILEERDQRVRTLHSPPVFLDTNFTKENIFKRSDLIIKSLYNRRQDYMEHTVFGISDIHVQLMYLTVGLCQPRQRCDHCTRKGGHERWLMGLNVVGDFICKTGKNTSNCTLVGENEIKCITENVVNHSQCLWVELFHHPCAGSGVWENSTIHRHNHWCQWNSPPSNLDTVIEKPVVAEGDGCVPVVLASVFSVLVVLCLCILLFLMRKKLGNCLQHTPVRARSYPLLSVMPHILLLYARDCEPFMDLMVTFRNMLRDVIKSEVYDCFDHSLEAEIATGAVEWLSRLLERDDIKIVVVESECAMLRQKALFEGVTVFYRHPTWLDGIFLHGLKDVANDKRNSQYDRVFVVSIHGFTDGNDKLEFITPNTRYVIPEHVEELMTNLYRQTHIEYTEHLQAIERKIRILEEYKTNNFDYVTNLLRREH